MDGKSLKIVGDIIHQYFEVDGNGMLIPNPDLLRVREVGDRLGRQLKADTGLNRRMTEITWRADVQQADRPLGSTYVISAGVPLFGQSPLKGIKFNGRFTSEQDQQVREKSEKREHQIEDYILKWRSILKQKQNAEDTPEQLALRVELDQSLTGGGYDNTNVGGVTKSGLNFIIRSSKPWSIKDTALSAMWVEECIKLREHLVEAGLQLGSLEPDGCHVVRDMQESDGMMGFPVYSKSKAPLSSDVATRLLIESGVDTRGLVGSTVVDSLTGEKVVYRVIDALAYIMDHMTVSALDMPTVITMLVRTQRHGYTLEEDGSLHAKDGKIRSVYPPSAIPGLEGAMAFNPFLRAAKEAKVDFLPSLQDRPTRKAMIKSWNEMIRSKGLCGFALDWSKYDATVKGAGLATLVYYAVRPFYKAQWQQWIDMATYSLVYKYVLINRQLAQLHQEMYLEACDTAPHVACGDWELFGLVNGLDSGEKFTHIGGSMYGEVGVHRVLPRILGSEPQYGPQAGDDTDVALDPRIIRRDSVEETFKPVVAAAEQLDLDMNASKQIFEFYGDELVQVFLQDIYLPSGAIDGMGSISRYVVACPFVERNKGLTPALQELAVISKLQNGFDNYFVEEGIRYWFEQDEFLGSLFKKYGTSAFALLGESTGLSAKEIRQQLGLGEYEWGSTATQWDEGTLEILPIMARVAGEMSFSVSPEEALARMSVEAPDSLSEETIDLHTSVVDEDEA